MSDLLDSLASHLALGDLLGHVREHFGDYELLDHHTQGEFHHDIVIRVRDAAALPGPFLVIATNCNGGVKEVLCLSERPVPGGLWRWRCPESREFQGTVPDVLDLARTIHFFDPCELLRNDARSELRPEYRERQPGGGFRMRTSKS